MILTDTDILKEIDSGSILISPFNHTSLCTNSYDVHLSEHFATYKNSQLDAKIHNEN